MSIGMTFIQFTLEYANSMHPLYILYGVWYVFDFIIRPITSSTLSLLFHDERIAGKYNRVKHKFHKHHVDIPYCESCNTQHEYKYKVIFCRLKFSENLEVVTINSGYPHSKPIIPDWILSWMCQLKNLQKLTLLGYKLPQRYVPINVCWLLMIY